jgi:hypothetical protein
MSRLLFRTQPITFKNDANGSEAKMAYTYTNTKGVTYVLHSKETKLENGKTRVLYFFARDKRDSALNEAPKGYEVVETNSGLPVLRRKK